MHREAWKLHVAVFWIALLAPYAARAGVDTWTYSGVPAGPIYRLVAGGADDPWYAMSANGVWRTRTQGTSWQHVLAGSSTPLHAVLEGDPQDPEVVVAGLEEGYFVSENAGATWRGPLRAPNGGTLDDVVIHPAEPGVWTALERVPFRDEHPRPGRPRSDGRERRLYNADVPGPGQPGSRADLDRGESVRLRRGVGARSPRRGRLLDRRGLHLRTQRGRWRFVELCGRGDVDLPGYEQAGRRFGRGRPDLPLRPRRHGGSRSGDLRLAVRAHRAPGPSSTAR